MSAYSKPNAVGGQLIRDVVKFLRDHGVQLPIQVPVFIAVSGGSDSVALAQLLVKYGRRVTPKENIRLIHVNHGWRGKASDKDAEFVRALSKELKVPVSIIRAKKTKPALGDSWEDDARQVRKEIFAKASKSAGNTAVILTAHQAEDLAETVLWRLMTGASDSHGGGILVQHGNEIRPFLRTRKAVLQDFLKEEKQLWKEDITNHEGRFFRSKLRLELFPILEKLFPKSVGHLGDFALQAQKRKAGQLNTQQNGLDALWKALELKIRRPQWLALREKTSLAGWTGEIQLSQGWKLVKTRVNAKPHEEQI